MKGSRLLAGYPTLPRNRVAHSSCDMGLIARDRGGLISCKSSQCTPHVRFMLCLFVCIFLLTLLQYQSHVEKKYQPEYVKLLNSWDSRYKEKGEALDVFIFSHRRSGTHLTINLLRYGFSGIRVWKMNHLSCGNCTLVGMLIRNGGKVIHAYRDPKQVAASMTIPTSYGQRQNDRAWTSLNI